MYCFLYGGGYPFAGDESRALIIIIVYLFFFNSLINGPHSIGYYMYIFLFIFYVLLPVGDVYLFTVYKSDALILTVISPVFHFPLVD